MKRQLRAVDLFCGAGGSSTGAQQAGIDVVLAVNHWHVAIQSHRANHPGTRHICARIDDIDPRHDNLPEFDILMASPECTHHSIARGGMPVEDQKRATPWHVCAWAEARRPKWIVVENVREFRDWGPIHNGQPIKSRKGETFEAWLNAIRALGYMVEHRVLNAADFGAATKRLRLFVIARRGSKAKIPWPVATHIGNWRPASEIIDWSRPCPSIFDRKRPLADKTLARIESGLQKFVGPYVVKFRGTSSTSPVGQPLGTVTAGGLNHAIAVPFQFIANSRSIGERTGEGQLVMPFLTSIGHTGTTGRASYVHDPKEPMRTVTTRSEHAIVTPFLSHFHNGPDGHTRNSGVDVPLATLDTQPRHSLVMPFLADVNHGDKGRSPGGRLHSLDAPLATITGSHGKSLVLPFITEYYGTGDARSVDVPLSTVTTKHRHGLALVKLLETMESMGVEDIGFRMLDVDELAAASSFGPEYQLFGTKAEQIKQVGNAVPPAFMRAICGAIRGAA